MTGYNLLAQGTDDPEGPSLLAETLLGGLGALAVLLFLFASFLSFVPLLIAAVSILPMVFEFIRARRTPPNAAA